jgi:hypothetical protein
VPTESDDNCQHASCSNRKLALLIGKGLKHIIVFTDIIPNLLCPEAADEIQAYGVISAKMTLFILTTPSQ